MTLLSICFNKIGKLGDSCCSNQMIKNFVRIGSIFIPCHDALLTYVCSTHSATSSRVLQTSADLGSVNCRNRFSILTFQSIGKFFTMPKTTKAAPLQQSGLEMWRKKKKVGASEVEPDAMDVEFSEVKHCKRV